MGMANQTWLFLSIIVVVIHFAVSANGQLSRSCPRAESIIFQTIQSHVKKDPTVAPKLLRMMFHDCFVKGCDASILLDGPNSEKTAIPNLSLKGFDAIQEAKSKIERVCPGVVSCADILAIASRDSVVLTGGRRWEVPTGRSDGKISLASNTVNIPSPTDDVSTQIRKFSAFGLNATDLVILVGGHTIGTSACRFFSFRLYNFSSSNPVDPTINPSFVPVLQKLCPFNGNGSVRVPLDAVSVFKFDLSFLNLLTQRKVILQSDQRLLDDSRTRPVVQRILRGIIDFNSAFGKSMVKMSLIGFKAGQRANVRKVCNATG